MAKQKVSKHDEYLEKVQEFARYVDTKEKIVGINSDYKNSKIANDSFALKKLRKLYGYKIQMCIPD